MSSQMMQDPTQSLPQTYRGPGLIDIQINGYAGFDFNSDPAGWTPEQLHALRARLLRRGVVAVFPTFITDDLARLIARARRYAELTQSDPELAAMFPRLHFEGPFISPEDGPRGAHPRPYCIVPAAHADFLDRIREASDDRVGIITLAPELAGAVELIERCVAAGICAAIGHCQPAPEDVRAAADAGARLSTHLGNGSHQMLPRLLNYVQEQLAEDRLCASFIADGHHIPFSTLKNFIRAKTPQRAVLTTDAMTAAEMGPGRFKLGNLEVEVAPNGRASNPGQPNLAGSTLTPDMGVINVARHCGVSFEQAWAMASTQPAELIGFPVPEMITVNIDERGFTRQGVSGD